jgi:hypothetical protein
MKDGSTHNLQLCEIIGKGDDRKVMFNGQELLAKHFKSLGKPGMIAHVPDRIDNPEDWKATMQAIRRAKVLTQIEPHVDRIGKSMELLCKRLSPKLSSVTKDEAEQIFTYLSTQTADVESALSANMAGTVDTARTPFKLAV